MTHLARLGSIAIVTALAAVAPAAPAQAAGGCSTPWGSLDKTVEPAVPIRSGGELVAQRVGHHACYDRIVLDVSGPVALALVGYRPAPGGGQAVLDVSLRHDSMTGAAPSTATGRTSLPTVLERGRPTQSRTYTSVSYRIRGRLPYRVFVLKGPGNTNRIVVDVAHRW